MPLVGNKAFWAQAAASNISHYNYAHWGNNLDLEATFNEILVPSPVGIRNLVIHHSNNTQQLYSCGL
jgi:hypothetical protein